MMLAAHEGCSYRGERTGTRDDPLCRPPVVNRNCIPAVMRLIRRVAVLLSFTNAPQHGQGLLTVA